MALTRAVVAITFVGLLAGCQSGIDPCVNTREFTKLRIAPKYAEEMRGIAEENPISKGTSRNYKEEWFLIPGNNVVLCRVGLEGHWWKFDVSTESARLVDKGGWEEIE